MKSSMLMSDHNIYISHAWGGESEEIVQEIYKRCRKAELNIIMDRHDLGYRESISSFMQNLGRADAIILVVSNKYLHSEYCMFELLQIYENKNMIKRIFPVVLDEVSIAKSTERLELVKYWETETEDLETKIRELKNLSYIEGITDDLNLYQKIRNNIANLTKILKDINTLNIRLHKDNDYNQLINAIKNYIEDASSTVVAASLHQKREGAAEMDSNSGKGKEHLSPPVKDSTQNAGSSGGWLSKLFRNLPFIVIIALILVVLYNWMWKVGPGKSTTENVTSNQKKYPLQKNGMDIAEFAPLNTGQQPSKSESDSPLNASEIESVGIGRSNSSQKTSNTSPSQQPKSRIDKLVQPESEARLPNSSKPELAVVDASDKIASVQEEIEGGEEDSSQDQKPELPDDAATTFSSSHPEYAKATFRMEKVHVPTSSVTVAIPQDISSNEVEKDDIVYLTAEKSVESEGHTISRTNARVRARIIDARASHQGSRGSLGIRMEALETVDGQWLELNYHDIVERQRGEVIFKKGTAWDHVKIEPVSINLKIFQ